MVDFNSIFSYSSAKRVKVQDWRLGVTYYAALVAIFLYVVIYQLVYSNSALVSVVPQGTVRLQLQAPTAINPDGKPCGSPSHKNNCLNNFTSFLDLQYCAQGGAENWPHPQERNINCINRDGPSASGMVTNGATYLTTRVSTYQQTRACVPNANNGYKCDKLWLTHPPEGTTNFIADISNFTVLIDTNAEVNAVVEGNPFQKSAPATATKSRLYTGLGWDPKLNTGTNFSNHLCGKKFWANGLPRVSYAEQYTNRTWDEAKDWNKGCYLDVPMLPDGTSYDYLPVLTIMEAAGFRPSSTLVGSESESNPEGQSVLFAGGVILVEIEYTDYTSFLQPTEGFRPIASIATWTWACQATGWWCGYEAGHDALITYKATWLKSSKFKESVLTHETNETRTLEDRHGLWMVFVMTGSFYQFFPMHFFVQMSTFFSFLAIATLVVDSLMQYVLPERMFYKDGKNEVVPRAKAQACCAKKATTKVELADPEVGESGSYHGLSEVETN